MNSPNTRTGGDLRRLPLPESTRVRERELLRVAGQLIGTDSAAAAQAARLEVLKWAAQQIGDQLPDVATEGKPFEHLRGGRTCIGAGFVDDHRALWALRVDRPDINIAQRTWTTEVVIGHAPDEASALFSLRLLASSPEATLLVEPAVPGLVRQIATTCGLRQSGRQLDGGAWHITSEDDAQELVAALLNPDRTVPYLVCSVAESETQLGINSQLLAKVTLGIARVVVVSAAHTWVLTQHLGKSLSVFNGAVRAYMPGFSYDANPYAHRLFFVDPKANQDGTGSTLTALRWIAANESIRRLQLGADVLAFSAVREASLDIERERLNQEGSADAEQLRAAHAQIDALKDDLRRSTETQQWLSDEHKSIEEHAQNLEHQLRGAQSGFNSSSNRSRHAAMSPTLIFAFRKAGMRSRTGVTRCLAAVSCCPVEHAGKSNRPTSRIRRPPHAVSSGWPTSTATRASMVPAGICERRLTKEFTTTVAARTASISTGAAAGYLWNGISRTAVTPAIHAVACASTTSGTRKANWW